MKFTKTVPTNSGVYEGQLACDGSPRVLIWQPVGSRLLAVAECNGVLYVSGFDKTDNYLWGEQLKRWPRIEPPQPVPGDVMEIVDRWCRHLNDYSRQVVSVDPNNLKLLCDYIKSLAPPEVPPLPRRFRGTFKGTPVVGIQWDEHHQDVCDGKQQPWRAYDVKDSLEITEWIDKEQSDG